MDPDLRRRGTIKQIVLSGVGEVIVTRNRRSGAFFAWGGDVTAIIVNDDLAVSIDADCVQRGRQRRGYDRRDGKIADRVQVAAHQGVALVEYQAVGCLALLDGASTSQDQSGMEII